MKLAKTVGNQQRLEKGFKYLTCTLLACQDPWIRHTRRSPSCDYLIETRGADFISAIINKVEKVKNGIMNSYSRSNSSTSIKGAESEFSKMKLRETKTPSSSGWRLDPYKERGVGSASTKNSVKRKKKVR